MKRRQLRKEFDELYCSYWEDDDIKIGLFDLCFKFLWKKVCEAKEEGRNQAAYEAGVKSNKGEMK